MSEVENVKPVGAVAVAEHYRDDFAQVAPSMLNVDSWLRLATSTVRRDPKLTEAANADPGAFCGALLYAARNGLIPGTEQFYLLPRKKKGRLYVQGIVGYQGHIELMYRAGVVKNVVARLVRENDGFEFVPGENRVPVHRIDWAGDRGSPALVYAYAELGEGFVSHVVVLNRSDIDKIKAQSDGADSEYSPWQKWPEAMWLKSAVRQLQKWVPTSAEYLKDGRPAMLHSAEEVPAPHTDTTVTVEEVEDSE